MTMHFEVFIAEGPVSMRLRKDGRVCRFETLEMATETAKASTDGTYSVYAVSADGEEKMVASGNGDV